MKKSFKLFLAAAFLVTEFFVVALPLMITSETDIGLIESSKNLSGPFKRTTSRLYELTSMNYEL